MVTQTIVKFWNVDSTLTFNSDRSVDQIKESFSGAYPWIATAAVAETVEGAVKTITFTQQTSDKGSVA